MNRIGYSTGALAHGDVARGVAIVRHLGVSVVELSALRARELGPLVAFVEDADLSDFTYVSVHAPSDFSELAEADVVETLERLVDARKWPVVMHPDAVWDFGLWRRLGASLCFENMDKRKGRARTADELDEILTMTPDAQVCFDIAHARQVDSSMTEAYRLLQRYRSRIRQIHFSEVSSGSRHSPVSIAAMRAYEQIASELPLDVPVIIESPGSIEDATTELQTVARFLNYAKVMRERVS